MNIDDFLNDKSDNKADTITGHYGLDDKAVLKKVKYIVESTIDLETISGVIDACKVLADSEDEAMVLMHSVYMAKFQMHMNSVMEEMTKNIIGSIVRDIFEEDDED